MATVIGKVRTVLTAWRHLFNAKLYYNRSDSVEIFEFLQKTDKYSLEQQVLSKQELLLIRKALSFASRCFPFAVSCIVKSIAAKSFLNELNVASELHMAVRNDPNEELSGHVWISSDGMPITNPGNRELFVSLSPGAGANEGVAAWE